ncbi:uncharacterized protein LOC133792430 [Humulus lupulus]|uniref:uncharacterized protein LOC133792430 n=1 Tax=Humulus lupulus TaxID=3486 RepID=UPI002B400786|nr:uncharacterized protein LOC133792430 [Humulus lupulus]
MENEPNDEDDDGGTIKKTIVAVMKRRRKGAMAYMLVGLHLLKNILGITNDLSQVLQKCDQDIVNAMDLVKICKKQLQMMRDNGWDSLVEEVANSFSVFDKGKLIRLAQLYPYDFSTLNLKVLEYQLQTYIDNMRSHVKFSDLKGMVDLSMKLVETRKDEVYPLVYLLIKLALMLSVATASVERAFSAMNIVKYQMRKKMGDKG